MIVSGRESGQHRVNHRSLIRISLPRERKKSNSFIRKRYAMVNWWWLIPVFAAGAFTGGAVVYSLGVAWGRVGEAIGNIKQGI